MSETQGTDTIGEQDERDEDRKDPSVSGMPEAAAGRLEERQQRQHAEQQHGDTFALDSDPTDTSGIPQRRSKETLEVETPGADNPTPSSVPAAGGAHDEPDEDDGDLGPENSP